MKDVLEQLIHDCIINGVEVSILNIDDDGNKTYGVSGFSKSGTAKLHFDKEQEAIICKTRYNREDHVLSLRDLAWVAKGWYDDYKDREPFKKLDDNWKTVFIKLSIPFNESREGEVVASITNVVDNTSSKDLPF